MPLQHSEILLLLQYLGILIISENIMHEDTKYAGFVDSSREHLNESN
jgi:hypothetical protein